MPESLTATRRGLLAGSVAVFAAPALDARARATAHAASSIPARVADLLARMTLEEKAAQLHCMWETKVDFLGADRRFSMEKARVSLAQGIGQISRPSDIRGYPEWETHPFRSFEDTVALVNSLQRFLVEETRLGIPALFHDELAHGLLAGDATIFPSPPALGSTWDPELMEEVFAAAAREARARGTHLALTPVIDLARDPRFGRVEEMFGEDARHVAEMGVAAVRGLQGRQRPLGPDRVFATLKHFVHGSPQGGINLAPADMSERTLRSTFLVPFGEIIDRADPAVIMPSYNEVQGLPAHASVDLLQTTGRRRLGFKGAYFSDYDGIAGLVAQHHVAATLEDAAVLAMNAGIAADLPEGRSYVALPALVRAGRVSEAQLDAAVSQVLALKFEAGLFEHPYIDLARIRRVTGAPAHVALARKAAAQALVLLKNDGLLPIAPKSGLRLAVIGPNAVEPLFGGYSGDHPRAVGVLEGLRKGAPRGMTIEHAEGVWITPPDTLGRHRSYSPIAPVPEADDARRIAEAVELAKRSDIVLLVLGDTPAITREAIGGVLPGDRSSLGLWGRQDALVEAIAATGKPIAALLLCGRPLAVPGLAQVASALFQGWYLGQEGGNAFADVLFGRASPGGKLAISMPRSAGELPIHYDRHPSADINHYLESKTAALFPFGHGLSYTTFDVAAPRLARPDIAVGETAVAEVDVTNTGKLTGDEVVQLYLRDEVSSAPRPMLELKAFRRVTLAAGERRTLRFELTAEDLALWDSAMRRTVEPGTFTVYAGSSSASLKSAKLTVRAG